MNDLILENPIYDYKMNYESKYHTDDIFKFYINQIGKILTWFSDICIDETELETSLIYEELPN